MSSLNTVFSDAKKSGRARATGIIHSPDSQGYNIYQMAKPLCALSPAPLCLPQTPFQQRYQSTQTLQVYYCDAEPEPNPMREALDKVIAENNEIPLPKCLKSKAHKAFYMAFISKIIQALDSDTRSDFLDALADTPDEKVQLERSVLSDDFLRQASKIRNCQVFRLAIAVGKVLGIHPEYCFNAFPGNISAQKGFHNAPLFEAIIPNVFLVGEVPYRLNGRDYLYDLNGVVRQIIYRYTSPEENIFIYSSRSIDDVRTMDIGKTSPAALLVGRFDMNERPFSTVLWPLNSDVLFSLRMLANEGRLLGLDKYVVAGIYGGGESLNAVNAADLEGHDVVIIVSPDCEEWEKTDKIIKLCQDNGANNVSIFTQKICDLSELKNIGINPELS